MESQKRVNFEIVLNMRKFRFIILLLVLQSPAFQLPAQNCYYDFKEVDPITGELEKGNTFNVGDFIERNWQLRLNKKGNRYFVGMYIRISGYVRDIITPKNQIIFKLASGEIVTIHANNEYVPISQTDLYGGIYSYFSAWYSISEEDFRKLTSSRLTYLRVTVGTRTYDESFSKRKGKLFQRKADCIFL
jgi:hypothetical protein